MLWFGFVSVESLALTVGVLILLRYFSNRKWSFFAERNIPTDTPSIFKLGTMGWPNGQKRFTQDNERKQRLGPVYGIYVAWNPILVIHDLEIMRQIYTKEFENFPERRTIFSTLNGKEMNQGVNVVQQNKWKRIRSTLTPNFSMTKLKHVFDIADQCAEQTVRVLQRKFETDDGVFVPRTTFSNLALDVIITAALGMKTNPQALDGKETRLAKDMRGAFKIGLRALLGAPIMLFPFLEPLYFKLGYTVFPKDTSSYVAKLINDVIDKREEMTNQEKPKDLLQLMLNTEVKAEDIKEEMTKGLTRNEVVGNAMLMVGAGFENTTNAMVFLAYNLAFHPEVQKRLQKEVDAVASEKGEFDFDAINGMKYLGMCINESLRLYQPVFENGRICRKETTICGLTIPKNMTVRFPSFGLAHDSEFWDDPWQFKPDRMEDMSLIDPMTLQTFGAGPRGCLGIQIATMEIKLTFFKLLRKFTFEPCENTPKPPPELEVSLGVRTTKLFELRAVPRETK